MTHDFDLFDQKRCGSLWISLNSQDSVLAFAIELLESLADNPRAFASLKVQSLGVAVGTCLIDTFSFYKDGCD